MTREHEVETYKRPSPMGDGNADGAGETMAAPSGVHPRVAVPWPAILFVATLATTTWAGALHQGVNLLAEPSRWLLGVPYALALVGILGVHELGHYMVARRRGVDVTLPYFIPAPVYLGTFGAFIRMRSTARDRAAAFDIAIAGPLAGLAAALVALAVGLRGETVAVHGGTLPSSSILLGAIYPLVTGASQQDAVQLGALAFAGWIGLVVTALNLAPVGQLDGGHIAYALLGGRRAALLGQAVIGVLVLAGVLYSRHWLTWALIAWLFAGTGHPPVQREERGLGRGRTALAIASFVLLLAIVLPWPG